MSRYPDDYETDPARNPASDREDEARARDLEGAELEPDRSVSRHDEEAEEAELAEEDILEIADLDEELDARKGESNDA